VARKTISTIFGALLVSLGALGLAPAAGAATTTPLVLSQSAAFAVLGYSCGGIQEHVYATGFALNGYPAGDAYLKTTCSGGGRGSHPTTHTAWASATWTWYGATRSYGKLEKAPEVSTTFSETDTHGDRVYNTATAAFLETTAPPIVAPQAPTGVTATAFRTGEEGQTGPQDFQVGWVPASETGALITSSKITATPIGGSKAPVLSATVSGSRTSGLIGTLEPNTTYQVTVTNTDAEGTSKESTPIEAKSLPVEEETLVAPIVISEPATQVTPTSATLNGAVNPAGEPVGFCQFEYGTSEAYGSTVACSSLPGEGETPVFVSAPVSGLTANTTYHFRLVAGSPGGTTHGFDQSFTAQAVGEVPTIKKLSPKSGHAIGGTKVTITGTGFSGATAVDFGANEGIIVSVNSDTSMTVESPPGTIGTVDVTVTTPGGTSAITSKDHFKYKK
jgi:IPT/TIG domain-containing protein/fibronectin type III domain protein